MPKSILLSIDLSDPQSSNQALKGALSKDFKKTALLRFGQALGQWTQKKYPNL